MRTYLCHIDEIAEGGARGFDTDGSGRDTLFVVRHGGEVRAWLDACPHVAGAPLAWRKDAYLSADGQAIVCYGHGAVFEIDTGLCVRGPCVGKSLTPATLERDSSGALWVPGPKVA